MTQVDNLRVWKIGDLGKEKIRECRTFKQKATGNSLDICILYRTWVSSTWEEVSS